jgi:hypothetical protein
VELLARLNESSSGNGQQIPTETPQFIPLYSNLQDRQSFPWNYLVIAKGVNAGFKLQNPPIANFSEIPAPGNEGNKTGMLFQNSGHLITLKIAYKYIVLF